MRGAVPAELREPASMIFYREDEGGLLWELIGEPAHDDHGRSASSHDPSAASADSTTCLADVNARSHQTPARTPELPGPLSR